MKANLPDVKDSELNFRTRCAAGMLNSLPMPKKKNEAVTVISLGRYIERNVDRVRVLDGGTTVVIRRADEDKNAHAQRWELVVLKAISSGLPIRRSNSGIRLRRIRNPAVIRKIQSTTITIRKKP